MCIEGVLALDCAAFTRADYADLGPPSRSDAIRFDFPHERSSRVSETRIPLLAGVTGAEHARSKLVGVLIDTG